MSAQRTKKYRALKKILDELSSSGSSVSSYHTNKSLSESDNAESISAILPDENTSHRGSPSSSASNVLPNDCDSDSSEITNLNDILPSDESTSSLTSGLLLDDQESELSFREKLQQWAVRNIANVTNACISELLVILRDEGHVELPKTAETLLATARCGKHYSIEAMDGNKKKCGEFTYLGVQKQLEVAILPEIYTADSIRILVNVDGMPLYNRSNVTLWPILIHLCDDKFQMDPLMVGAFCGVTKPKLVDEFLNEFVNEVAILEQNGIEIKGKRYEFKIVAFVCDTPARSFIKCTKGHTGFHSCERCEIRGATVEDRRVFPEMDCRLRTKESFEKQTQPEHHQKNMVSPLLKIPGFDPVNQVTLDYMHLLCAGTMKFLLDKWINGSRNSLCSMKPDAIKDLQKLLGGSVTPNVPKEFQRKTYDLYDLTNWKATQNRFFLLYAGVLMKNFLSKRVFRHFMLLFVACRMLCGSKGADLKAGRAKEYLRKFFKKLPTYYGNCSQTMNMHNLIHVADDVINLKMPLSRFSAFPFENYLGKLKKFVRTPRAPLAQIVRRLSEIQSASNNAIRIVPTTLSSTQREENGECTMDLETVKKIQIGNIFISSSPPDNIVQVTNGDIVQICNIFVSDSCRYKESSSKPVVAKFEGYRIKILPENIFEKPCPSSEVGIMKLGLISKNIKIYCGSSIKNKCIKLNMSDDTYAITLLHGH